jgi:hypothetical protein
MGRGAVELSLPVRRDEGDEIPSSDAASPSLAAVSV